MPNKLKDLWLRAIGLVESGANQESKVVLAKAEHGYASMDDCLKENDEGKCKELMAAMKTQTAGTGQTVILDLTKTRDEPMPDPDILKALADSKAEGEAVKKALAEVQKEAAEAKATVAKMEDERQRNVYITKAHAFKSLPGVNPDDFGPLLRKAHAGMSDEERTKFDAVLHGAVKVAEDSALFRELGAGPGSAGGDAYAKLEAKARAMIEKSANALTFEQAFAKVSETPEGRKLYDDYEKERADAVARRVR